MIITRYFLYLFEIGTFRPKWNSVYIVLLRSIRTRHYIKVKSTIQGFSDCIICDLRHTLRYRSYFSATVHKNLKIKRLKNCFKSLFPRCRIFFYIYLDHIMQKNTNYLSHVTCHSPVTCHILRKLKILELQFSRTSCRDFVLASKINPKFEFLMPQVMRKLSIFSKCDMLQGCYLWQIICIFCMIWFKYM